VNDTEHLLDVATRVLPLWGLEGANLHLVAQRENTVFKVNHQDVHYALRLHRPGYQTPVAIASELAWMDSLAQVGVPVPAPVASLQAGLLVECEGFHIDLLTWLYGRPMGQTDSGLQLDDPYSTFAAIGEMMARLHEQADIWQRPANFERRAWDEQGLLGEQPLWGRFWENPSLPDELRADIDVARRQARQILQNEDFDYGLIHADLVRENILIEKDALQLIDFDDCGFGYRLFDVATTLSKNWQEPDAQALQAAFIKGYERVRTLQWQYLPLFTMLRAFTYVGWIVPRINEPGSADRQQRFMGAAKMAMDDFQAQI
jgi:Ser/Thr protein kinase RdoA (MazF antagonist)